MAGNPEPKPRFTDRFTNGAERQTGRINLAISNGVLVLQDQFLRGEDSTRCGDVPRVSSSRDWPARGHRQKWPRLWSSRDLASVPIRLTAMEISWCPGTSKIHSRRPNWLGLASQSIRCNTKGRCRLAGPITHQL